MMPVREPVALAVKVRAIPETLKVERRWVGWRFVMRSGKWTKAPINPKTGTLASTTNPTTWSTFEAALAAMERHHWPGIGFVLGDGWAGVDLDNCRTPAGDLAPWAAADIAALASYTEVSPSQKGIKVFLRGTLPPGSRRRNQYEMYDTARFFTVTGHHLPSTPATVEDRTDALAALHARIFPEGASQEPPATPRPTPILSKLDDQALIDRARSAKNGAKFDSLWRGEMNGYTSQSEADLALASLLTFWCGPDPDRVDRLFRQSGLYRDKWDREDYRLGTLDMAMQRTDFYEPAPEVDRDRLFSGAKQPETTERTTPWLIPVADLLAEPDEPDVWLCEGIWRAQTLGIIVGPPKTYKSFFAQELAVALATGTPLFGIFAVAEPVTVIYVQEESARTYLRRRFHGILRGRKMHPEMVRDTLFTITNERFRLDDEQHIERLVTEGIDPHAPRLLLFDPMREMHWQDENKAESMMPILSRLKYLRDDYALSVGIIHHNNKNPLYTNPADSIRGSSAIWGAMDAGLFVSTTEKEGQVKVNVIQKEGGQVRPFLYAVRETAGAITFDIVEMEADGKTISDQSIIDALVGLGWCDPADVALTVALSERRLRPRLQGMAQRGEIRVREIRSGRRPKIQYGPKGVLPDAPDF